MMSRDFTLVNERRVVVAFQLGILMFILAGLFSSIFSGPRHTANIQETVSPEANSPRPPQDIPEPLGATAVRAKAAYVWDVRGERALYAKNETTPLPLASITKLMTALLAYELVTETEQAAVSNRALAEEGDSGLLPGENLTIAELNQLALIASSNDAAYTLAASVGALLGSQDPAAQFVEGMNIRAEELALDTFTFKNTTGLDLSESEAGAVGSAADVSRLMAYILATHPDILEPTKRSAARVYNTNGEYHDVENTNEVLYAIPNLLGSKTGYTDLAGGNLTIAFDAGMNRPIIVTVLGSTREERFTDVLRLVAAVKETIPDL